MHRFRKKSDASTKRGQVSPGGVGLGFDLPDIGPVPANPVAHELPRLAELPPASNFRTSLILPDLTRRFTLLRTPSGQPLSIEQLRTRFADQRARGADNQISEAEEDMILETLGRIRGSEGGRRQGNKNGNANVRQALEDTSDEGDSSTSREGAAAEASPERFSVRSSNTVASSFGPTASSVHSSPSSRSAKRYSNNLFSSGRMRDYNYNHSHRSGGSQRNALSITSTESSFSLKNSTYSDRLVTPDRDWSVVSSAQPSLMTDKTPVIRSAPLNPPGYLEHSSSTAEYRLSNMDHAALKRASLALEEALKEIEEEMGEEAEDEIVMPRSAPASRTRYSQQSHISGDSTEAPTDEPQRSGEAGTAISSDKHSADVEVKCASPVPSSSGRPGTISPSPRLPGYIPGMPRPMTPRDPSLVEADEQSRPHSTTPRPISPLLPGLNGRSSPLISASITAGLMRRDSNTSTVYTPRSPNGTVSFDDQRDSADVTMDDALSTSILGRRRPASPLAGPAYQPMAVSSRPGTPSNVTWNTSTTSFSTNAPKVHGRNESGDSGRSRGGSLSMDGSPVTAADESNSVAGKALRSPILPDSPIVDRGQLTTTLASLFGWDSEPSMNRTPETVPNLELNTTMATANRTVHSPTQTSLSAANDLLISTTSRRASQQNAPSSTFNLGSAHSLNFSPRPNSSRSSFASVGSSYHSDEGGHKKDRDFDLFGDKDTQNSTWHDISSTGKTSATHDDSQDSSEAEDILNRYAGLTKLDFVAIQEKLVGAALAKAATPDPRERVPSLRRRRPSTSQSSYSLNGRENRVTSPVLQTQAQAQAQTQNLNSSTSLSANTNNAVNGNTQDPNNNVQNSPNQSSKDEPSMSIKSRDLSPSSRRNRDLAQALFGTHSNDMPIPSTQAAPLAQQKLPKAAYHQPSPSTPARLERSPTHVRSAVEEPASAVSPTSSYPMQMNRNPSILRSPQTLMNQSELVREVQRKTEAATASLKRGPSAKYNDTNASSISLSRKRITPHQISTPHLVSASTSMDTIPLRSPSVSSGNMQLQKPAKLGQRIRRWGTLRGKSTIPTGDEITPFPLDVRSARTPPTAQNVHLSSPSLNTSKPPASTSITESGMPKALLPSPPATAGPGLKGFMSRFRKPRTVDMSPERDRRSVEQERRLRHPIFNSSSGTFTSPLNEYVFPRQDQASQNQSAPASKPSFQSSASRAVASDHPPSAPLTEWSSPKADPSRPPEQAVIVNDTYALKQLFDAASNLGLDQTALNDLLARSASTSSRSTTGRTTLTRNLTAAGNRPVTRNEAVDSARSPPIPEGRPSTDAFLEHSEDSVISNVVPRKRIKPQAYQDGQDGDVAANAIVRRTIIFPSDSRTSTIDLNILMRKNSSSARRHRSASAGSVTSSSRSVHDRAPTPPPPRSPTGRRFSHDASPPVPQLPTSFSGQAESLLPLATPRPTTASPIEKSSSAYDSLYEMYAGERATPGISDNDAAPADVQSHPGLGRGVEVIEMANGETIWSIVNGLRDEDVESSYASRSSFASDNSVQHTSDGVQVFFKEHGRTGSKGSNSSFLARRKLPPGKNRPETKVFYSSSNQIGRLIENLSEGYEAGSFNFLPTKLPGHAHTTSLNSETDTHWTVEERLEQMIGSMGNP